MLYGSISIRNGGLNMIKLEKYIEKRKKEDGINEFDKNKKMKI